MKNQPKIINEDLRTNDLKGMVFETFTIDRFKSKMGEDKDIIVLGFKVKEKFPAIDLMEFIEKGYPYILDADVSNGEEDDGKYYVFVEMERTSKFPGELKNLLDGVSRLTDCWNWNFVYQKSTNKQEVTSESLMETVPLTPDDYEQFLLGVKNDDVTDFFDQGSVDVTVESDNTITFKKPYSGDINAKFVAIGPYEEIKKLTPGPLDLSESGQSKSLFLNKFLGNYDISKINNHFLIRNKDQAIIIKKDKW